MKRKMESRTDFSKKEIFAHGDFKIRPKPNRSRSSVKLRQELSSAPKVCPEDIPSQQTLGSSILASLGSIPSLKELRTDSEMTVTFMLERLSRIDERNKHIINEYAKVRQYRRQCETKPKKTPYNPKLSDERKLLS